MLWKSIWSAHCRFYIVNKLCLLQLLATYSIRYMHGMTMIDTIFKNINLMLYAIEKNLVHKSCHHIASGIHMHDAYHWRRYATWFMRRYSISYTHDGGTMLEAIFKSLKLMLYDLEKIMVYKSCCRMMYTIFWCIPHACYSSNNPFYFTSS